MTVQVSEDTARALDEHGFVRTKHDGWMTTFVDRNNPEAVAKALALNKKERAEVARQKAKSNPTGSKYAAPNNRRMSEIQALFKRRYGYYVPDDDAGISDMTAAITVILATESEENARGFARRFAPWCTDSRFDQIIEEIGPNPQWPTGDELAEMLDVDYALRQEMGFRNIGATDVKQAQRKQIAKKKDADRNREKGRKAGATPREQYESTSKSRTKPWVAAGMGRTKWFEEQKKAKAEAAARTSTSDTNLLYMSRTHLSAEARPQGQTAESVRCDERVDLEIHSANNFPGIGAGLKMLAGVGRAVEECIRPVEAANDNRLASAESDSPNLEAA